MVEWGACCILLTSSLGANCPEQSLERFLALKFDPARADTGEDLYLDTAIGEELPSHRSPGTTTTPAAIVSARKWPSV